MSYERCYWKSVSLSDSVEGRAFQQQHPEIPFPRCRWRCSGFKDYGTCEHYQPMIMGGDGVEKKVDDGGGKNEL